MFREAFRKSNLLFNITASNLRESNGLLRSIVFSRTYHLPDRNDYSQKGSDARREWVEHVTGTSLKHLDGWWEPNAPFDEENLVGNIESPIGITRIPTGIMGPVKIRGKHAEGCFLVPGATIEGSVIATATRGCKAMNESGGVVTNAYRQLMQRNPAMICGDSEQAARLGDWIQANISRLHPVIRTVSQRARLITVNYHIDNEVLHLTFPYTTAEAAGQNMTTVSTKACTDWILETIKAELPDVNVIRSFEESTLSGDKGISSISPIYGRGVSVTAKVSVPEKVINSVLKTDSEGMLQWHDLTRDVALKSGQLHLNFGTANMIAAVFAATGQDLGCVNECSQSFLNIKQNNGPEGGIDAIIKMPNITVGTVGGGTDLPTQTQCLDMMSCSGPKSNFKLAEIISAVSLGYELSLIAAQASGDHARALDKLGRNRPVSSTK